MDPKFILSLYNMNVVFKDMDWIPYKQLRRKKEKYYKENNFKGKCINEKKAHCPKNGAKTLNHNSFKVQTNCKKMN